MYAASKIARKTSEKTANLKGEMYFATETSLAQSTKRGVTLHIENEAKLVANR
jgi:hypothetical protein